MKTSVLTALAVVTLLSAGCAWVKLTPQGEKVRLLEPHEVTRCKKVGSTTVSLKAKVGPYERSEERVREELTILGRNSGADTGGDTIVFDERLAYGKQRFDVYKCVNP